MEKEIIFFGLVLLLVMESISDNVPEMKLASNCSDRSKCDFTNECKNQKGSIKRPYVLSSFCKSDKKCYEKIGMYTNICQENLRKFETDESFASRYCKKPYTSCTPSTGRNRFFQCTNSEYDVYTTFQYLSRTRHNKTFANVDSELTKSKVIDPVEYDELINSASICQQQSGKGFDDWTTLCDVDTNNYGILQNFRKCNNR